MGSSVTRTTHFHSGLAAVLSIVAQPIPALDELVIVPIHFNLCARLARTRGVPVAALPWKTIKKIIWYGAGLRVVANVGLGLIPVVGTFANAVTAVALTEYLGRYLDEVLADPLAAPRDVTARELAAVFVKALRDWRRGGSAPPIAREASEAGVVSNASDDAHARANGSGGGSGSDGDASATPAAAE